MDDNQLFQRLLEALPEEYTTLRDGMIALSDLSVIQRIQRLKDKEDSLARKEVALAAAYIYKSRRRDSEDSSESKEKEHRSTQYYLYNGEHFVRDCPFLRRAQAYTKKELRHFGRKHTKHRNDKKATKPYHRDRKGFNKKNSSKKRAYNAEISEDSDSDIESSSSDLEEEEDGETAAISRKAASKISFFDWVADSGASAHITNQLRPFTGPLTKIRRRIVKVGGGKLYTTYIGRVLLKPRKGHEVVITNVFLVPGLGVNLLSGKRLTESGLEGRFDSYSMHIVSHEGKVMLKAPTKHGIYVVDWVSRHINEIAALNTSILLYPSENPIRTMPQVRVFPAKHTPDQDIDMQLKEEASLASNSNILLPGKYKAWNLWHRRFAYFKYNTIRKLYRVTTLKKPILYPKSDKLCEVCSLTKIR